MDIPQYNFEIPDSNSVETEFARLEGLRLAKYYFECCDAKEKQYEALATSELKQSWTEKALINAMANLVVVVQLALQKQWTSESTEDYLERLKLMTVAMIHTSQHNAEITGFLTHMKFEHAKAVHDAKEVEELSKLYAKPTS